MICSPIYLVLQQYEGKAVDSWVVIEEKRQRPALSDNSIESGSEVQESEGFFLKQTLEVTRFPQIHKIFKLNNLYQEKFDGSQALLDFDQ